MCSQLSHHRFMFWWNHPGQTETYRIHPLRSLVERSPKRITYSSAAGCTASKLTSKILQFSMHHPFPPVSSMSWERGHCPQDIGLTTKYEVPLHLEPPCELDSEIQSSPISPNHHLIGTKLVANFLKAAILMPEETFCHKQPSLSWNTALQPEHATFTEWNPRVSDI